MRKIIKKDNAKKRPTIAFVTTNLIDSKLQAAWLGIEAVAQAQEANLVCFLTGELSIENDDPRKTLCDLIDSSQFDGLIVFQWWRSQQQFDEFYQRFSPMPVVNIMRFYQGATGIMVDNYQGMRHEISHFIEVHGHRQIAFIRGTEGTTSDARYQAYLDTLAEYNIPYDPKLVILGDFQESAGREAIQQLLKNRENVNFEAVVAANDLMANGVLLELQKQGINVPNDLAVAGFDNEAFTTITTPPLTTVKIPYYEMGQKATEALLQQLAHQNDPEQIIVPAQQITRRSCGCFDQQTTQIAARESFASAAVSLEVLFSTQRESIIAAMVQALPYPLLGPEKQWMEQLLDAFRADLLVQSTNNGAPANTRFLSTLDEILGHLTDSEDNIASWQEVLSEIKYYSWPCLLTHNPEKLHQATTLWEQGRVFIGLTAQQAQLRRQAQQERQTIVLNGLGTELLNVFDTPLVMQLLTDRLPQLGLSGCYLALYVDPTRPEHEVRLMVAFNEQKHLEAAAAGQMFPSFQSLSNTWFPQQRRYSLVAQSLYVGQDNLGYVLFETGPSNGQIYETLQRQISGTLKSKLLVAEQKRAEAALSQERDLLQNLMNNSPDMIFFKDTKSRIIRSNAAHARALGYDSAQQLIGKTDFDLFSAEDAHSFAAEEEEILRTEQPVIGREWHGTFGQQERWVAEHKVPIKDAAGQPLGLVIISRDITERKQAEIALAKRVREMETVAQVSTAAATVPETAVLLQTVVDLTKTGFNLYHVHIYLLDNSGETLVLTAGAGEVGRQLVTQGWSIPLDSTQSFVALVARSQQGVFINDITQMMGHLPNPLLPQTRSEMAVPLVVGERVLGVLDVQANTFNAFTQADLQVQTTLAGQIAIVLENARLLEQTQAALAETEATHRRYLTESWQAFRRSHHATLRLEQQQTAGPPGELLNGLKKEMFAQGKLIAMNAQSNGNDPNGDTSAAMVAPLKLQGQVIGALGLQDIAKDRRWTEQEIALVEAVTEQVTQALERARLFEQTQQRAAREKVIADVTQNVWASDNLEKVMKTAVEQLGVKLDASKVVIRLGTEAQILAGPYLAGANLNTQSQPVGKDDAVPEQATEL